MQRTGKLILKYTLVITNLVVIVFLLLSAYSGYVNGEEHPARASLGLAFPLFICCNALFVLLWCFFRRWKWTLLPLGGYVLCAPIMWLYCPLNTRTAENQLPASCFKLMTYNVMSFNGMEKENGENAILNYIRRQQPDIICMQEFAASGNPKKLTRDDINKVLSDYPYQQLYRVGNLSVNQLACYSKFPILSTTQVDCGSDTHGAVMYQILVGTDTLVVFNNHLESNRLTMNDRESFEQTVTQPMPEQLERHFFPLLSKLNEGVRARSHQAKVIADTLATVLDHHKYVVVCGDFNDSPLSDAHRILSRHLDDAFAQSGRGMGTSFNRNRFYFRIDHILVSGALKSYNCTVDHSIRTSDHYPVWCYIAKRDGT